MNVKRLRRKCDVRGCKNYDVFAISRVREAGNSVIICKSCLEDALKAVKKCPDAAIERMPKPRKAPPLFYEHVSANRTVEEPRSVEESEVSEVEKVNDGEAETAVSVAEESQETETETVVIDDTAESRETESVTTGAEETVSEQIKPKDTKKSRAKK